MKDYLKFAVAAGLIMTGSVEAEYDTCYTVTDAEVYSCLLTQQSCQRGKHKPFSVCMGAGIGEDTRINMPSNQYLVSTVNDEIFYGQLNGWVISGTVNDRGEVYVVLVNMKGAKRVEVSGPIAAEAKVEHIDSSNTQSDIIGG